MTVDKTTFLGDARYEAISANFALPAKGPRLFTLLTTTAGLDVTLPDARRRGTGGIQFIVHNIASSTESLTLKNNAGGTIGTILAGHIAVIFLLDNSTQAGSWITQGVVLTGGPGQELVTLAGTLTAASAFTAKLSKQGEVELAATLTAATAFSGQIVEDDARELAGTLEGKSAFSGAMVVEPAANIVSPTATGGGNGTVGNPYTLKEAALAAIPGDTIVLRGGVYGTTVDHRLDSVSYALVNGTSGNVITYQNWPGELPVLTGKQRLSGAQYITCKGLRFESPNGEAILDIAPSTPGTQDIVFDGCEWDADLQATGPFSGILCRSVTRLSFLRCKFFDWPFGDQLRVDNSDTLHIFECDFTQSRADHANIATVNTSDISIVRCAFRNPWDRCIVVRERETGARALIEDCLFFDSNWEPGTFHPNPNSSQRGSDDIVRPTIERAITRNCVFAGQNLGKNFSYNGQWRLALFGNFLKASRIRLYNCVFYKSLINAISFTINPDAFDLTTTFDNRFYNLSVTDPSSFGWYLQDNINWASWRVENCRFADSQKSKVIALLGEPSPNLTVAEAQTNHGSVFKNLLSAAAQYNDESLYAAIDANPSLFEQSRLEEYFEGFSLVPGSSGTGGGRELAKTTASGTSTDTIPVNDAYAFWAGSTLFPGDRILVGSNSVVTITNIFSATQLTVDTPISFNSGDSIYLERMGTSPDVGLYPLTAGAQKNLQGTLTAVSAFMAQLAADPNSLAATLVAASAFSGELSTDVPNLVDIDHDTGDLSQYDSSVTDGGDLSVTVGAALNSSSHGLQVVVDDATDIYGRKAINWTTDVLRGRFYLDPNSIGMTSGNDFFLIHFLRDSGFSNGYVRLKYDGTNYRLYAGWRDDASVFQKTGEYVITDAPHYVEVRVKYAANATSNDGELELIIDGTSQELRTNIDLFDRAKSQNVHLGAPDFPLGAISPGGTLYLDELIVREVDTEIGA